MKQILIVALSLCLTAQVVHAQSDKDRDAELKELKEEINALKKDLKSDNDAVTKDDKEDQEAKLDALRQELDDLKDQAKSDKNDDDDYRDASDDFTYKVPDQKVYFDEKAMSQGVEPCFVLMVPNMDDGDVKDRWKDYMGNYKGKLKKVKGSKRELLAANVTIYDLGYDKYDVYSTVYESGSASEIVVWLSNGDQFIAGDSKTGEKAKRFMEDFGVYIERRTVDKELLEQEKILKNALKDQEKLQKEHSKLENKIADWEKDIREAREKLARNVIDQENQAVEVQNQSRMLDKVEHKVRQFNN